MADYRKEMMEKFERMKARQQNAKETREKKPGQESGSNRQRRKKDEDSSSRRNRRRKNKEKFERNEEELQKKKKDRGRFAHFIDDVFMSVREFKRKKITDSLSMRQRKKERNRRNKIILRDTIPKISHDVPSNEAQKENICKFLSEIFGLGVQGLLQQYQTYLKTYVPPDVTRVAFDKNMERNRYKDVVCIDQTRVILRNTDQDYIHASYVRGEPFVNQFICTQGPMRGTVNDFWIMVMQERVSHIFMLCNVTESGKSRCAQYWPPDVGGTAEHAGVVIKNLSVDNDDSTLVLTKLEAEGRDEHLTIKHVRWKNWPDKGVPSSVFAPFRMLKMARQSTNRPTVVHCSAGIGRTGCIVATEMAVQILLTPRPLDLVRAIQQLRAMRMSCVQTDTQFVYVVRCLLAYAMTCGVLQNRPALIQKAAKFEAEYEAYFAAKSADTLADAGPKIAEGTKPSIEQSNTGAEETAKKSPQLGAEQNVDAPKQNAETQKMAPDVQKAIAEKAATPDFIKLSAEVTKANTESPRARGTGEQALTTRPETEAQVDLANGCTNAPS